MTISGGTTRHRQQGVTLFELLIAVLLLGIISTMIYSMLHVSISFADRGERKVQELAHEHGLLELINRQVNDAWYDARRRRIRIAQQHDMLQIYTRFPLLFPEAGLVLAIYRYDEENGALYYTEKRDFYNAEYTPLHAPELNEMRELARFNTSLELAYDAGTDLVAVRLGGAEYIFQPRAHQKEISVEGVF